MRKMMGDFSNSFRLVFLIGFFICSTSFAQSEKLQEQKELEAVNFSSIKKVLQQDGLSEEVRKKVKQVKILKKEQSKIDNQKYFYPTEKELWGFVSEYWLIKNAQLLSWDFEKPDYGLEVSFKSMLENLGFYQKRFKILLLKTPSVVRASLPGNNETILLLSLPFIRSMDLSKLEISLLLLEDFIRLEQDYFRKNVRTSKFTALAGKKFRGSKPDVSLVEEMLKNYSHQITRKGFTFQEQFKVTKKMDAFLKGNPVFWNAYFRLLGKIDRFIKGNAQYKDYIKLYPSPEMQVKWLTPEEKVL